MLQIWKDMFLHVPFHEIPNHRIIKMTPLSLMESSFSTQLMAIGSTEKVK